MTDTHIPPIYRPRLHLAEENYTNRFVFHIGPPWFPYCDGTPYVIVRTYRGKRDIDALDVEPRLITWADITPLGSPTTQIKWYPLHELVLCTTQDLDNYRKQETSCPPSSLP